MRSFKQTSKLCMKNGRAGTPRVRNSLKICHRMENMLLQSHRDLVPHHLLHPGLDMVLFLLPCLLQLTYRQEDVSSLPAPLQLAERQVPAQAAGDNPGFTGERSRINDGTGRSEADRINLVA